MLFPIKLPSSEWMSILLSVSITLSSLVLSSPIPAGSTGSPDRNVDTRGAPWAEASPTAEQCIRVLRARRFELAQPETPESPITVKTFALMMSQLAYHHIMEYGTGGVVEIDDPNLESMMPCVIPDEVGLTLGDLKTPPTGEMSLETLVCHWQALENLQLCTGLRESMWFSVPWVESVQQQYTDKIISVMEATDLETWWGEVSLPQAPPTKDQLLHWIWLLRERRIQLAQPETLESQFMVDNLAHMMRKHTSYFEPLDFPSAELRIKRSTLQRMMQHVIPKAVPLTLDDLLKNSLDEMSLEMLKLHLEALKNLHMQYLPFIHKLVVIPLLAEPQQQYRDRFEDLVKATDWETEWGEVSLHQAPPTKDQLLHWIWLLREWRIQLAQRTLKWECDELDLIIETRLNSRACSEDMLADKVWPDSTLEFMLPYVIPDEVGLTLRDLMKPPTDVMDLEMLACRWEALENLLEPLRHSGQYVPRVERVQQQYTDKFMAVAAVFDKQGPYGHDNLGVPVIVSADIHNPVSTPAGYSAAPRAESVFSDRGLTGSSGGKVEIEGKNMNRVEGGMEVLSRWL
ncbi:hypothetical protein SeMB42_g00432 [Synchytrium endobioticum]|uniref:Uncharacterized protein n=1 Tax=Synchytrium endobioticum TaxID=286115 RepID=A0A507DTD3_9FUNG|nr:hypothetical protein SeMB42_g00432 [Synchytrium endobioticum]